MNTVLLEAKLTHDRCFNLGLGMFSWLPIRALDWHIFNHFFSITFNLKDPQGMLNPFCPCHEQTTKKITNKSNFIQILHYSWKRLSWRKHVLNWGHAQRPVVYMKTFEHRLAARTDRAHCGQQKSLTDRTARSYRDSQSDPGLIPAGVDSLRSC